MRTFMFVEPQVFRLAIGTFVSLILGLGLTKSLPGQEAKPQRNEHSPATPSKAEVASPNFDKVGPQVGDQLPDLTLRNLKGEPQRLADAWHGGPALLVTSSLTCPKSRSRWPEVQTLVDKYGEKLNVAIVYVIEAHPVGSICPYKGVEEVTQENERDGILRRQPTKLDERLELAQEFKRYLRVGTPIYVDTINNSAWKAFGAAPNIAFLVDTDGIVRGRESWFDGKAMQKTIDEFLAKPEDSSSERRPPRRDRDNPGDTLLEGLGLEHYQFSSAIEEKDTDELESILKRAKGLANYVFEAEQGHGQETTALMEAAQDRNPAAVKLLLSYGADVNAKTYSIDSALQVAAIRGDLEIAKLLLEHHADAGVPRTGKTPIHEAALGAHLSVVKLLATAGARADLYSDIALGNLDAVKKRLAADPSLALRPDGAGRMPLDYAAANSQIEVAKLLLGSGAPVVEIRHTLIDPPLHRAIERADVPMVKLLLDAGSSPDTAVGHGGEDPDWTPALHIAVEKGNVEIVNVLLAHKADLKARNTYSQTALHVAAEKGRAEIAALLIQAGADVNAPQLKFSLPCGSGEEDTPSQNTPLHFAAARGNPQTIDVLLKAGAKLEARNVKGLTPLMSTVKPPLYTGIAEESQLKNIEVLLAAGADVNARDKDGQTILDAAKQPAYLQRGNDAQQKQHNQALLALLKKHGAKPGIPKAQNSTPQPPRKPVSGEKIDSDDPFGG